MIHRLVETEPPRSWAPGKCECGAVSRHVLPSYTGRERWLRAHKLDALMHDTLGGAA